MILKEKLQSPGSLTPEVLCYEIAGNLTEAGIGQSTCLGIGGDRATGLTFVDVLKLF